MRDVRAPSIFYLHGVYPCGKSPQCLSFVPFYYIVKIDGKDSFRLDNASTTFGGQSTPE